MSDWKTVYLMCNASLDCSLSDESINGSLQAAFLTVPRHAFVKLDQFQTDWFERHIHRLTPETRDVMANVFGAAKEAPWGFPLFEKHMVELLTTGNVCMTWARKVEKAGNRTGIPVPDNKYYG